MPRGRLNPGDRNAIARKAAKKKTEKPKYNIDNLVCDSTLLLLEKKGEVSAEKFKEAFNSFIEFLSSNELNYNMNWVKLFNALEIKDQNNDYKNAFQVYTQKSKTLLKNNRDHSEYVKNFQKNVLGALLDPDFINMEKSYELLPSVLESNPPYILLEDQNGKTHLFEQFKIKAFGNSNKLDQSHVDFIAARDDIDGVFSKIFMLLVKYSAEKKLIERGICDAEMNLDESKLKELMLYTLDTIGDDLDISLYINKLTFPEKWAPNGKQKFLTLLLAQKEYDTSDLLGEMDGSFLDSFDDSLGAELNFADNLALKQFIERTGLDGAKKYLSVLQKNVENGHMEYTSLITKFVAAFDSIENTPLHGDILDIT